MILDWSYGRIRSSGVEDVKNAVVGLNFLFGPGFRRVGDVLNLVGKRFGQIVYTLLRRFRIAQRIESGLMQIDQAP